jgi:hypothetical protein
VQSPWLLLLTGIHTFGSYVALTLFSDKAIQFKVDSQLIRHLNTSMTGIIDGTDVKYPLSVFVYGVSNLAVGEENKKIMGNNGIIETLMKILRLNEDDELASRVEDGFNQSRLYSAKVSLFHLSYLLLRLLIAFSNNEGTLEFVFRP